MSDRTETRLPPALREAGLRALSTGSAYALAGAVAGALAVAYQGRDASWLLVVPVVLVSGLAGALAGAAQAPLEARCRSAVGAALAVACAATLAAALVFVQGIYTLGVLAGGVEDGMERVVLELTDARSWPMTVGGIVGMSLGAGLALGNDVFLRRQGAARARRVVTGAMASFVEAIVLMMIGVGVFQAGGAADLSSRSASVSQLTLVGLCCAGLTLVFLGGPLALALSLTEAAVARLRPRGDPTSS